MTMNESPCPVGCCAEIISGKWTLLVIRDLADGSRRFCELERSLEGISPRTLSLRLRALEEHGIVERHTYPEVPPRVEYALTEKGRALVPLIEDMRSYGRRWLVDGSRRPPSRRSSRLTDSRRGSAASAACRQERAAWPGEACAMRDLVVREALEAMARDAAERLARARRRRRGDPLRGARARRRLAALPVTSR